MSNVTSTTVPSVTLQTAVLDQVKWFANSGTVFSVHDVTRNVRRKVAQGELEIPETEIHGSSFRNDIPHVKVKSIFDDLWQTGVFDPFLSLSRKFNGTYFEYTPTPNVSFNTPTPVPTTPVTPNCTSPAAPVVTIAPVNVVSTPTVNDADVKARIVVYLKNCVTRNFRPTLKQVQSAIKRSSSTGWTCENIGAYIENELGYTVVSDPDFISASQVAVV